MPKKRRPQRIDAARNAVRVERMYPVYARKVLGGDQVLGEAPLYFINLKTRDVWMEQGAVVSISRGKAIRLLLNLPPRPQVSITTQGVSDGVAEKRPYALAVLAAWSGMDQGYCHWPRQAA